MCAINGIINWEGIHQSDIDCVKKSLKEMDYRGPDFSQTSIDDFSILGHNRLAILDLNPRANQPLFSEDKRYSIVFNGEIYNYKILRNELISLGVNFKSTSDTEVLLNGFILYGIEVLKKLRGMFAFVIWDKKEKKIFAARDRFGEKPFYFINKAQNFFCFASNLNGIVQLSKEKLEIDKVAVYQLLNQQYIDVDTCIYKGIKKIHPGSYLLITKDKTVIKKYWQLDYKEKINFDFKTTKNKVQKILKSAVSEQLEADVSVGVFLSGGVDSSIIASIASKQKNDITALTISTPDDVKNDESKSAAYVANTLKINHKIIKLNRDCVNELPYILKNIEPLSDASLIPSTAITKEAKKEFKVMLSGDGGDEVFGGYKVPLQYKENTFKGNSITSSIVNNLIKKADNPIQNHFYSKLNTKRIFKWGGLESYYNNTSLSKTLEKEILNQDFNLISSSKKYYKESLNYITNKEDSLFYVGIKSKLVDDFLFKIDSSSMHNSIESRAPFLDHRLIEFTSKLSLNQLCPNNIDKEILKSIGTDYLSKEFFNLPKKGFSIPYYNYLENSWGDILLSLIKEGVSSDLGLLKPNSVEKLLNYYKINPNFRIGKILYSILILEIWLRVFHLKMNPNDIKLI
ncbi:asparagine synthase (glutamine-hydrolyzing) [Polaribacter sp. SA4-12]|uniref:asparagine synthase (glutamine-hydrolyzing) n=1 Tax=Polaribacter sp. SA4-12 TaxID=1312072 RepID=UPI000B3C9DE7|nr:asparagine synthase (glutamine-hydrolyzing) [Polaribacter sp. SA4-12]ARV13810.1 asparagine synthase (glutamine-hydrolyzing) [Polaribacter sp. SA4-12]